MRYRVIREYDRRYPIRLMCRALAVLAAGYYAWRSRPESLRSREARTLLSAIRVLSFPRFQKHLYKKEQIKSESSMIVSSPVNEALAKKNF